MKKVNEKGFTLAELLIVVAIIAILVAIAIPTFSDQLERSREAVDISNLRSAYSQALTKILTVPTKVYPVVVEFKQQDEGWTSDTSDLPFKLPTDDSGNITFKPVASDGTKTLFFMKKNVNDDKIEVKDTQPTATDGADLVPVKYSIAEDKKPKFEDEEPKVGTPITAVEVKFEDFYDDTATVDTPTTLVAIDFGGIKGLEYESMINGTTNAVEGFKITGTAKAAVTTATTITFYMLDKNGVLGYYDVTGVTVDGRG